jgi:hypothetical protein
VNLARQANCEVADVDHFLNFTQCFGANFSDFNLHEVGQSLFMGTQLDAEVSHDFSADRGWNGAPSTKDVGGCCDGVFDRSVGK